MPNFWFPPGDTTRNQQIHHKLLCGKSKICSGHQVRSQGALRSWSVHILGRVEHLVLWGSLEHRVGGGGWVSPTRRYSASLLASRSAAQLADLSTLTCPPAQVWPPCMDWPKCLFLFVSWHHFCSCAPPMSKCKGKKAIANHSPAPFNSPLTVYGLVYGSSHW